MKYQLSIPLNQLSIFSLFLTQIKHTMKKFASLLVFITFLNSCDDGNLTLETIDFENVKTQSCTTNNIIYKLKDKESLLLEIPKSSFTSDPTLEENPTTIDISSTNRVVYRFYNGNRSLR